MNVVVVGAGIVGCAVARELAVRGARVRLFDPRGPGDGATRASAGVLAPYIEGHIEPLRRLGLCSLEHYDRFVERVAADAGTPVEYQRSGTLQVACGEAEARELEASARALAEAGAAHTFLSGSGARELEPALTARVSAGLLVPQHGYVGVHTLMSALSASLAHHGAIVSQASVLAVGPAGDGLRLETSAGEQHADAVVLAAGSWSGTVPIRSVPPVPVRPVRGQLLHLRLPAPPLSRVVWGSKGYLVPWRDGSLLVGATVEDAGFDETATAAGVRRLLDMAEALVPAVRDAGFEEVRVGLRPATTDELPVIGASSTMRGVFYATGHYRNGVLLAPLTALMLADLILDGRERRELALVRPGRFGL